MTWLILIPFVAIAGEVITPMIDAVLADGRRASAERCLAEAAARRMIDPNVTDDERAAIRALIDASG
jgi:hypothetical protein